MRERPASAGECGAAPALKRLVPSSALSFGLRTQLANVLAYSSARVDLLLVYALAGQIQAGYYSVALTLGTITGFVAIALSYSSFPPMTRMADDEALGLTTQLARAAFAVGVVLALGLSVSLFALIPLLLGTAYDGSLTGDHPPLRQPALGGTWTLSRAIATRGDAALLLRSSMGESRHHGRHRSHPHSPARRRRCSDRLRGGPCSRPRAMPLDVQGEGCTHRSVHSPSGGPQANP